jgi:hypothetical protein
MADTITTTGDNLAHIIILPSQDFPFASVNDDPAHHAFHNTAFPIEFQAYYGSIPPPFNAAYLIRALVRLVRP